MKINYVQPNARRGASIVIALIIFLLCALAGASAFIMAAANAGRYSHSSEQKYYSVSSAALMMVDLLDGLTYKSKEIDYDYTRTWEYKTGSGSATDPKNQHNTEEKYSLSLNKEGEKSTLSGADDFINGGLGLPSIIRSRCDVLVPYLNVPGEWYDSTGTTKENLKQNSVTYNFTITVQNESKFGTVNGTLVMNDNYNLVLTFNGGSELGSGDEQESEEYAITVYWVADVNAAQTTETPKYTYYEKTGEEFSKGSMTQNRKLNVTVTWDKANVTISRGEATNA